VTNSYRDRPASELRRFVVCWINAVYAPSSVNSRLKRANVTARREWICHFVFTPADVGITAAVPLTDALEREGVGGYLRSNIDWVMRKVRPPSIPPIAPYSTT